MFAVVVTEKGGEQRRYEFDKNEVTIGRVQGNDVIMPKGNVSKRHSRIVVKDGKFIIVDLKSTNGTYVNGRKITSPLVIKPSDRIYIGDFILHIDDGSEAAAEAGGPPPPPPGQAAGGPPPRRSQPPPRRAQSGDQQQAPPPPRRRGAQPPPPEQPPYMEDEPPPAPPEQAPPQPPQAQQAQQPPPPQQAQGQPQAAGTPAPAGGGPAPEAAQQRKRRPPRRPSRGAPRPQSGQGQPAPQSAPPQPATPSAGGDLHDVATPVPDYEGGDAGEAAPAAPGPEDMVTPAPAPAGAEAEAAPAPAPRQRPQRAARPQRKAPAAAAPSDAKRQKLIEIQREVHDHLIERMDLRRLDMDDLDDEELREKAEGHVADIVAQLDGQGNIPAFVDQDTLIEDVLNEALGLGPLEEFLDDESITEVMVNRSDQIYVERDGRLVLSDKTFSSDKAVMGIIERIVNPLGRRIDESSPLVDARLKDGSRVNAIIPPLALKGPSITIRKFKREMLGPEELVHYGTCTPGMMDFLKMCVHSRRNVLISGGTGSGKTTTLNILSNFIPDGERIITVEDAAELQIRKEHWLQLESRPPNIEGKGEISIRDLVKNTLRMRPDRIVVGECRGGESLDMLQAMNTGHDGSLTTIHANTPRDSLARLETLVLMAGMELPVKAIREQIGAAIHLIAQQTRFADGTRKLTHISEVTGMEGDVITMQDIFTYRQEGFDEQGNVTGRFVPTGFIPKFYEDLRQRGLEVDMGIFRE
jgi:pilus assembly protein CpaF